MSENPGDKPGTSNEIEEVEEDEDDKLELKLDEFGKELLEKLRLRKKDEEKPISLREQMDKENPIDHIFINDENMRATYYLSAYEGSSFNGRIKVCSGLMTREKETIHDLDTQKFILAKSVWVQEPPSLALEDLQERARINGLVQYHPNIMGVDRSLTFEGKFYVFYENMAYNKNEYMVSLRSMLGKHFPNGMPVNSIIVCLRETLKGLSEIHRRRQVHKEISAGQIFLGSQGHAIKLGFSATIHDYGKAEDEASSSSYPTISEIHEWASAPEVYGPENNAVYESKADIWLIGILAVELAYGGFETRERGQLEMILEDMHRRKKLPSKPGKKKKKKSVKSLMMLSCIRVSDEAKREKQEWKDFGAMVMKCLQRDVNQRPTVEELLGFKIFVDEENDAAFVFDLLNAIEASID